MDNAGIVERLRLAHDAVGQAVARLIATGKELAESERVQIQREDLIPFNAATAHTLDALLPLIDAVEAATEALPRAMLAAELARLEPPREYEVARHPGSPRGDTPLGLIPLGYGFACHLDGRAREKRAPNRFFLRQVVELWQRLVYQGGTHASGGLAARLPDIAMLGANGRPDWREGDREMIVASAKEASFLAHASDNELASELSRRWCQEVRNAVETLSVSAEFGSKCLNSWIVEEPPPQITAEAKQLLDSLAAESRLTDSIRSKAAELSSRRAPLV